MYVHGLILIVIGVAAIMAVIRLGKILDKLESIRADQFRFMKMMDKENQLGLRD